MSASRICLGIVVAGLSLLLGGQAMLESAEFQALHSLHAGLLAAYRAQDWDGAARAVDRCAASAPALAELYALFRRRIAAYAAEPPGPDWDGVHVARSK